MSYTHILGITYSGSTGIISASFTETYEGLAAAEITFASDDTNTQYAYALDYLLMKTFWMMATQDCQVELSGSSESSSSPQFWPLSANVPVFWADSMGSNVSNPITEDIADVYITAEGTAGILYLRALYQVEV